MVSFSLFLINFWVTSEKCILQLNYKSNFFFINSKMRTVLSKKKKVEKQAI